MTHLMLQSEQPHMESGLKHTSRARLSHSPPYTILSRVLFNNSSHAILTDTDHRSVLGGSGAQRLAHLEHATSV